jgi:drug/metabolite transporter (DMT)-like permease
MFAGTLPAARLAVSAIDPWFLASGRAAGAGVIVLAILIAKRRRLPPRSVVTSLAIASLFVVFGFPLFSTFAMRTVPAAHGGVVLGILPLATAASAAVRAHEWPIFGFWLVGVLGAALVVGFALRHGGSSSLVVGDLLLLASIASSAIGYMVSPAVAEHAGLRGDLVGTGDVVAVGGRWRDRILAGVPRFCVGDFVDGVSTHGACQPSPRLFLPGMPASRWAASRGSAGSNSCSRS